MKRQKVACCIICLTYCQLVPSCQSVLAAKGKHVTENYLFDKVNCRQTGKNSEDSNVPSSLNQKSHTGRAFEWLNQRSACSVLIIEKRIEMEFYLFKTGLICLIYLLSRDLSWRKALKKFYLLRIHVKLVNLKCEHNITIIMTNIVIKN